MCNLAFVVCLWHTANRLDPVVVEATADYYKFFKTFVCENTDKTNSQPESFDEDVY